MAADLARAQRVEAFSAIDYSKFVRKPARVSTSGAAFAMNRAGSGHLDLANRFSTAIGLGSPRMGIDAARALLKTGTPYVYLTLTNDHQRPTEKAHDATLEWSRTLVNSDRFVVRFIGPPEPFRPESWRKKVFCKMSEELSARFADRTLRYTLPCAFSGQDDPKGQAYVALMQSQADAPLSSRGAGEAPLWIVRQLRGRGVIAYGMGMRKEVLTHAQLARRRELRPDRLAADRMMLLRFLDPPLLQHGVHLGTPVRVRFEMRVFGLVQWAPLRVWISKHGFSRAGTPWHNYTASAGFTQENQLMWELSAAPDPSCAALPPHRPPWVSAARFAECSRPGAKKTQQPEGCCICQTAGDTLDTAHGERGFATGGTLRKLEHVARAAGFSPGELWRSIDETVVRWLMQQQSAMERETNASALPFWHSPFAVDVAFAADGTAFLYEAHLFPSWKRPGHWRHPDVDRDNALGTYSAMLLASSHLLLDRRADKAHRRILGSEASPLLLDFLRDQGFASQLGMRRAWPSPRHAAAARYASAQDASFASKVDTLGLLLPSLDALADDGPGRPGAQGDLCEASPPLWPFEGALFKARAESPAPLCEDAPRILQSWNDETSGK